MKSKVFIVLGAVVAITLFSTVDRCFAQLINYDRLKKVQERKTAGATAAKVAPAPEIPMPAWRKTMPKVTTKAEQPYDVNNDGKLQPAEVKIFLRDILDEIDKKGGILISSPVLKEYDTSGDSIISRYEAEKIKQDVR